MEPINAISKVRFSSAKPQRVHLANSGPVQADLLCLECQQELALSAGAGVLYVVSGSATLITDAGRQSLASTQLTSIDADCTLANISEQRLVVLAFKPGA